MKLNKFKMWLIDNDFAFIEVIEQEAKGKIITKFYIKTNSNDKLAVAYYENLKLDQFHIEVVGENAFDCILEKLHYDAIMTGKYSYIKAICSPKVLSIVKE